MKYCSRGCGRPMVSSGGTCGDAYCAASPGTLDFPPASSPAHDPLTCTCCQIALAVTKERDKYRANYQWMVERAVDEKLDGYRDLGARAAKAEQERDDARHFARALVEKVRRIQGHIEAGGANEELTAATVLCSGILAEDEWGTV